MNILTFTLKEINAPVSRTLHTGQIHVWMFSLADTYDIRMYFSLLNPEEKKQLGHFQKESDQNRSLIGHSMLRHLLGRYLSYPAEKLCFETGPYGKPFLANDNLPFPINFNLSHSGEWIVLAFSPDGPIGIDIEKPRISIDSLKIIKRFFHPAEFHIFSSMEENDRELLFFRYWTIREAFLKGLGGGFSLSPDSFLVKPLDRQDIHAALYQIIGNSNDYSNWRVQAVNAPDTYVCSVCYQI